MLSPQGSIGPKSPLSSSRLQAPGSGSKMAFNRAHDEEFEVDGSTMIDDEAAAAVVSRAPLEERQAAGPGAVSPRPLQRGVGAQTTRQLHEPQAFQSLTEEQRQRLSQHMRFEEATLDEPSGDLLDSGIEGE